MWTNWKDLVFEWQWKKDQEKLLEQWFADKEQS